MVVTQESAQSLATLNGLLVVDVRTPREQQDIVLPLVIALRMVMLDIFAYARRSEPSPNRTTLDRHSSFTDLTQRSA